jgi:hypothetical protein
MPGTNVATHDVCRDNTFTNKSNRDARIRERITSPLQFFSTCCLMPSSVRRTPVLGILKYDRIEAMLHVVWYVTDSALWDANRKFNEIKFLCHKTEYFKPYINLYLDFQPGHLLTNFIQICRIVRKWNMGQKRRWSHCALILCTVWNKCVDRRQEQQHVNFSPISLTFTCKWFNTQACRQVRLVFMWLNAVCLTWHVTVQCNLIW